MANKQRFRCPVCGRKVIEVARQVATDSRSRDLAEAELADVELAASPACMNGHPPTSMRPL
jgi:hypothetical protein